MNNINRWRKSLKSLLQENNIAGLTVAEDRYYKLYLDRLDEYQSFGATIEDLEDDKVLIDVIIKLRIRLNKLKKTK